MRRPAARVHEGSGHLRSRAESSVRYQPLRETVAADWFSISSQSSFSKSSSRSPETLLARNSLMTSWARAGRAQERAAKTQRRRRFMGKGGGQVRKAPAMNGSWSGGERAGAMAERGGDYWTGRERGWKAGMGG